MRIFLVEKPGDRVHEERKLKPQFRLRFRTPLRRPSVLHRHGRNDVLEVYYRHLPIYSELSCQDQLHLKGQ